MLMDGSPLTWEDLPDENDPVYGGSDGPCGFTGWTIPEGAPPGGTFGPDGTYYGPDGVSYGKGGGGPGGWRIPPGAPEGGYFDCDGNYFGPDGTPYGPGIPYGPGPDGDGG